jgi:hypothetical protein
MSRHPLIGAIIKAAFPAAIDRCIKNQEKVAFYFQGMRFIAEPAENDDGFIAYRAV